MATTYANLGKIVKEQYPNQYGEYTDEALGKAIVDTYPEYAEDISFIESSYGDLAKGAPKAALKDAGNLITGFLGTLAEGGKLFGKSVKDLTNVGQVAEDFSALRGLAKDSGQSTLGTIYNEGVKPVAKAFAGSVKEEYIAPEGRGETEFLTKRGLAKPVSTGLDIAGISAVLKSLNKFATKANLSKTTAPDILEKIVNNKPLAAKELKVVESAKNMGLAPSEIDAFKGLSGEMRELAIKYIDQAKAKVESGSSRTLQPTGLVGEDVAATVKKLEAIKNNLGAKIGAEVKATKSASAPKLGTDNAVNAMVERLRDLNVKVKKNGGLDFRSSDISGLASDQKLIKFIWQKIAPTQKKGGEGLTTKFIPQRDTVALIRNIGNQLYAGKVNKKLGASEGVAEIARQALSDTLGSMKGNLAKYNKDFSEVATVLDQIKRIAGPKLEKVNDIPRRVTSNASGPTSKTFDEISRLAEKYNIPEGKNLVRKTDIAIKAQDVAGIPNPTSFQAEITKGIQGASRGQIKAPFVESVVNRVTENLTIPKTDAAKNVVLGKQSVPTKAIPRAVAGTVDAALSPIKTAGAIGKTPFKGANPFIVQLTNLINQTRQKSLR